MRRIGLPLAVLALLIAAAPTAAAINFDTNTVNVGSSPRGIVSDFFHGGGNGDLVTANFTSSNTSLLLGNGAGSFANANSSPFSGPLNSQSVDTGDFNRDGNVDEVTSGQNSIDVRLGDGAGGLGAPTTKVVAGTNGSVVTGDFNNDNNLDFAASTSGGGAQQINVFLGNGSGTTFTLTNTSPIAIGQGTTHLAAGDFNNDNIPDSAVTSDTDHTVQVFRATGAPTGTFVAQPALNLGASIAPAFAAIGDVNNDGNQDLVVTNANGGASGAFVFLGNGSGGFSNAGTPTVLNVGNGPQGVAIDDIDFDDFGDLVVANNTNPGGVTVLLNQGNGRSYTNNGTIGGANFAFDVTTNDFNNDGNIDIAVSSSGGSSVTTYIQRAPGASVNPTSLNFGNVTVNTTSPTQSVTLTNNGGATIGPLAQITGNQRGDFRLTNDRCSPSTVFLGPGGTCTIGVQARSGSTGGKSATLEISSNAANSPQRVALSANIVPPIPVNQIAPAISGTAVVGNMLTCSNGTWKNSPTAFAHQWLRNGNPIAGAATATYPVVEADVGQQVACRVTASNAGGNSQARTSNAVVPSAATPVLSVTVPKQTLNSVLRKGLTFNAACANACRVAAQVRGPVPPRKKRRSTKKSSGRAARTAIVGRTTSSLNAGTSQKLTVKISRAGRSALRKKSKATLKLSVTATDPSGSPSTTRTTSVSVKKAKARKKRKSN